VVTRAPRKRAVKGPAAVGVVDGGVDAAVAAAASPRATAVQLEPETPGLFA